MQFARGHGAVINQRYAVGLAHLRRILDPADPAYHPFVGTWGLADLVRGRGPRGRPGAAQAYLEQLESLAAQTVGPAAAGRGGLRAARWPPRTTEAEPLYLAALADGLANWPDYRARMLLRYGGWLRRQRRAGEARRRYGRPGTPSTLSASPGWRSGRGLSCGRPGNRAAAANRDRGTS